METVYRVMDALLPFELFRYAFMKNALLALLLLTPLLALLSVVGDLSFSIIKRTYCIKDYGNLMPGHGGVLDRFDSVLFIAPAVYFIAIYLPIAF